MSHVVEIKTRVKNLEALKAACEKLGLEFREGRTMYNWYGRSVGDYPLPKGFTAADLGRCDHAIGIKGTKALAGYDSMAPYEIGVVKARDGEGYTLVFDFWQGGHGIEAKAGKDCDKLLQYYGLEVSRAETAKAYELAGWDVTEEVQPDGYINLVLTEKTLAGF